MLYQLRKRLPGHPGNIQTHERIARKRFVNIFNDICDDRKTYYDCYTTF